MRTPSSRLFALITLASLWPAAPLQASGNDELESQRSPELVERSAEALLTMYTTHASLRVRRTVYNGGERADEAHYTLRGPKQAVAVGLRTQGHCAGKPCWFDGELLEARTAAWRYYQLTGKGPARPKDPALLAYRDQGELSLHVFPVLAGKAHTVEYTYLLPVAYTDGKYRVSLPEMGLPDAELSLALESGDGGASVALPTVDELELDGTLRLDRPREVTLSVHRPTLLRAALGSAKAGNEHVVHFDAQAAPRISSVPRGAYVVVAVDTSRSRSEAQALASTALAQAYLAHFPDDTQVRVITFDREVHELYAGFTNLAIATRTLGSSKLHLRNGTNLLAALHAAERALASAPAKAPRRILLITDLLVPSSQHADEAARVAQASGAIMHVVSVDAGEAPRLQRWSHDVWSAPAAATGGVLWRAAIEPQLPELAEIAGRLRPTDTWHVFEHLARPVRLECVALDTPGRAGPNPLFYESNVLEEGEEIRLDALAVSPVERVLVRGCLWSRAMEWEFTADRATGDRAAALAFGNDLTLGMDDAARLELALRGRAVSPVTSYLAIEPGVRPSTEGFARGGGSGSGFGRGAGSFRGKDARLPTAPEHEDPQAFLDRAMRMRWQACGGSEDAGRLVLETTYRELAEIVSIDLTSHRDESEKRVDASVADTEILACMRAAVWTIDLPAQFSAPLAEWHVSL